MIRAVTYSAANMTKSRALCVESARKNGADIVYEFEPKDIGYEFSQTNAEILKTEKGAGLWLWKAWAVNRTMQSCEDGDFLVYIDAGCEIIADLHEITRVMEQDIFLFSNGHQHAHWCKSNVLKTILHVDMIEAAQEQVQASLMFFRVNQYTRNFIKEWFLYCQMPGLIDDSVSPFPNHPEFAEHRYDQAIICTLAIRDKIQLHWWPDKLWYENQRYRWPNDKYPAMVRHHRKRNHEW